MPRIWPKIKARLSALYPLIPEHARRFYGRATHGFWSLSFTTLVLTFVVVALVVKIFFAGLHLSSQAIESGQRVLIHLESGEIDGLPRHTQAANASTGGDNSIITSKEGLAPAPYTPISEETDKGLVPIVAKDGTLPWKYYAKPYTGAEKRPVVAIAITDLGLSKPMTEDALTLPHGVTLSFSPYASDARKWAKKAREEGFETLVDLPMQTVDYMRTGKDPGPYGMIEEMTTEERTTRLRWTLSRFPGFVGVLAPEDEALTPNLPVMRPILTELAGHGVLFLYLKTPKNAALAELLQSKSALALGVDRQIDATITPAEIGKQLDELAALAKTQGYAVGFAHPYTPTIEAIARWAEDLNKAGVDLVPVSAVAQRVLP